MLTLYRLVHQDHVEEAWTGKKASRVQLGRWHLPGIPMVYMFSSVSQALMLQQLYTQNSQSLSELQVISLIVPTDIGVGELSIGSFDKGEKITINAKTTQQIGSEWWKSSEQMLLRVPSTIFPKESLYLLNVLHADFKKCISEKVNTLISKSVF